MYACVQALNQVRAAKANASTAWTIVTIYCDTTQYESHLCQGATMLFSLTNTIPCPSADEVNMYQNRRGMPLECE